MAPRLPRIWIVTDPSHPSGPVAPVRRTLEGCPSGLVGVQLRAKKASDRQLVDWGRELRAITKAAGSAFSVNRRMDVAEIVGADGVHLPERGLPPAEIRRHWPALEMLGVSRHDQIGLRKAERDSASYAFLSPVFEVLEKGPEIGIEGFAQAIADVGIPTYALGGLRAEHLGAVLDAGGYGVAVRRAIYAAARPENALQTMLRELDKRLPNSE